MIERYQNKPFDPTSWNCLNLAKQLHDDFFEYSRFPDVSDSFRGLDAEDASNALILWLPIYCEVVNSLNDGCLVVLNFRGWNLGSYYEGNIYYMGNDRATFTSPSRLSKFIDSIWQIKI